MMLRIVYVAVHAGSGDGDRFAGDELREERAGADDGRGTVVGRNRSDVRPDVVVAGRVLHADDVAAVGEAGEEVLAASVRGHASEEDGRAVDHAGHGGWDRGEGETGVAGDALHGVVDAVEGDLVAGLEVGGEGGPGTGH